MFGRRPILTKRKVAQLIQSPKDKAEIVILAADEIGFITGTMGGCCSVVVLYGNVINLVGYLHGQGHHAGGGPEALDWDHLTAGFDSSSPNNKVVMCCAKDNFKDYSAKVTTAFDSFHPLCKTQFEAYESAFIGRDGTVRAYHSDEDADFTIRNKGRFII